jgi:hypothetical protein
MFWSLLVTIYRQQLFEQPQIAANCIMFLRKYLENMNFVIPHWVVILNETVVSANGSSIKKSGRMALVSLFGKGDQQQI